MLRGRAVPRARARQFLSGHEGRGGEGEKEGSGGVVFFFFCLYAYFAGHIPVTFFTLFFFSFCCFS